MVPLTDSESSLYCDLTEDTVDTRIKNSDHRKGRSQATEQSCGIEQPFTVHLRATGRTEGQNFHKDVTDKGLVHNGNSVDVHKQVTRTFCK